MNKSVRLMKMLKNNAMNLPTKIFGGFTIVVLLCIMLTWINRRLSEKVEHNMAELAASEEILKLSSDFQRHIVDMETGCRGYLLGDHKEFLDEYYAARMDIPAILQEASLLVKDNPVQDGKLHYISERLNTWQTNFAEPLIDAKKKALLTYGQTQEDVDYDHLINKKVKPKYDKYLMDDIKASFKEFDASEYKVRRQKRAELAYSIHETREVSLYVTGICVLVGLLVALFITYHISNRARKMVALAKRIAENDFDTIKDDSSDELGRLSQSLNVMSSNLRKSFSDLQRINAELDRFILLASHDVKEPLRMISIYTQLLLRKCQDKLDAEEQEYAGYIVESVHRIQALIHDLLEYTQAGKHELHYREVNCEALVKAVQSKLKVKINETSAKLIYNDLPVINSDEDLLCQLLEHLIDNAIKFRKEANPEIRINVQRQGGEWLFSITDNGIGLDQRYEEKIFSVFQRLHEREKYNGTGIGLALCKKIIELHGGRIWYESRPGEGATFYFTIPIQQKQEKLAEQKKSLITQLLSF